MESQIHLTMSQTEAVNHAVIRKKKIQLLMMKQKMILTKEMNDKKWTYPQKWS